MRQYHNPKTGITAKTKDEALGKSTKPKATEVKPKSAPKTVAKPTKVSAKKD